MRAAFTAARSPRAASCWWQSNADLARTIRTPQLQEFYRSYTIDAVENTTEQLAAYVKADRENAANVFRAIGVRPQAAP